MKASLCQDCKSTSQKRSCRTVEVLWATWNTLIQTIQTLANLYPSLFSLAPYVRPLFTGAFKTSFF